MNRKNYLLAFILCVQTLFVSAQVYPVRAKLTDEKSFSMILLPDPQSYTKFDANQPLFELQTAWVANSIESLNIKGVLCTGDLVEQNEIRIPDGVNGNQTSEEQWRAASRAFERLDGKLPYVICTGNHDYGYQKAENRLCHFPDYFPAPPTTSSCTSYCIFRQKALFTYIFILKREITFMGNSCTSIHFSTQTLIFRINAKITM